MTDSVSKDMTKMLIKKQACFNAFTDQEVSELATLFTEEHVKAGETIVKEGDEVDSVFLIVSGNADVRHVTYENQVPKSQSVATLGPDSAIGLSDTGFYSLTGKRTATVVAMTAMVLLRLSVPRFHGFSLVNPHVNEEMHKFADKFSLNRQDLDF